MIDPAFYTKIEEQSETYSRFIFTPLQPSFGQSMGNALRRTLLASLKGAAIGQVRVEGVPHLFATIKGVKESALDLVLNLKQLRFATDREGTYKVKISAKGQKKIYGRDVEGEVEVVNKDLYIGELTDDKSKLELEAVVETGYGYVSAEEKQNVETGFIAVDSAYSPVKQVNFRVEEERVGRKSNFDRLVLEVWTDGSITPKDAVSEATQLLAKTFQHIFSGNDVPAEKSAKAEEQAKQDETKSKLEDIIIDELNLPSRVINALLRENIETVADLLKRGREELAGLKGVGRKSIDLIDEEFKKMGIELK